MKVTAFYLHCNCVVEPLLTLCTHAAVLYMGTCKEEQSRMRGVGLYL